MELTIVFQRRSISEQLMKRKSLEHSSSKYISIRTTRGKKILVKFKLLWREKHGWIVTRSYIWFLFRPFDMKNLRKDVMLHVMGMIFCFTFIVVFNR